MRLIISTLKSIQTYMPAASEVDEGQYQYLAHRTCLCCGPVITAKWLYLQEQASPRDMRRIMMRGRKVAAWRRLTLPERDVLTCLTAICKVGSSPVLTLCGRTSSWKFPPEDMCLCTCCTTIVPNLHG